MANIKNGRDQVYWSGFILRSRES